MIEKRGLVQSIGEITLNDGLPKIRETRGSRKIVKAIMEKAQSVAASKEHHQKFALVLKSNYPNVNRWAILIGIKMAIPHYNGLIFDANYNNTYYFRKK